MWAIGKSGRRHGMDERIDNTTSPQYTGQHRRISSVDVPSPAAQPAESQPQPQPFHRTVPHVTQEPINDVEPEYVTRNRYMTLEEAQTRPGRKHMGVAVGDNDYLGSTGSLGTTGQFAANPGDTGAMKRQSLHYERYLETPKPGKTIFTSRRRKQRRAYLAIAIIAILMLVLAIVWFFFLR